MSTFNLPDDAAEFLRAGRQFEYDASRIEAGEVKLKRLDELSQGEVWIGTDLDGDPHAGEDGYYGIPAVSLTGECKAYDPDFILLWLPQERLFGTWDCDHGFSKYFAVPVGRTSLQVRQPTSMRSGIGRTRSGRSSCRGRSTSSRVADHFNMSQQPNKPDRADRRQRFCFRKRGGEAGILGFPAAAAHLERWAARPLHANESAPRVD